MLSVTSTPDSLTGYVITKLQQIADMQKRKGKLSVQQYVLCGVHQNTLRVAAHRTVRTHCAAMCTVHQTAFHAAHSLFLITFLFINTELFIHIFLHDDCSNDQIIVPLSLTTVWKFFTF